ncbi:MAG: hypothetical protein ABIP06_12315 [Pyrinomonadaceae bacterium]
MKNLTKVKFLKPVILLLFIIVFAVFCISAQKKDDSVKTEAVKQSKFINFEAKVTSEIVEIGDSKIEIVMHTSSKPKPIYFRPHENENTSGIAVSEILKKFGGTLVELKSKGVRNIDFLLSEKTFLFDPNRIFTIGGIEKTLGIGRTNAAIDAVSDFVEILHSRFLTDKKLLIAVHNNTNGGQLSIETYKNNPDAEKVFINPSRDIDDFFYVTDEKFFKFLMGKGFNVVLQNNVNVTDDGSLSVYCGKNGIAYINVECEHGHLTQQIEMLGAIQEIIKEAE